MDKVFKIHDELFQFLLDYREKNEDFYFMPRQRQNKRDGRLDRRYWFPGDDDKYIYRSIFTAGEMEKIEQEILPLGCI